MAKTKNYLADFAELLDAQFDGITPRPNITPFKVPKKPKKQKSTWCLSTLGITAVLLVGSIVLHFIRNR
jgi:hypothetical protein